MCKAVPTPKKSVKAVSAARGGTPMTMTMMAIIDRRTWHVRFFRFMICEQGGAGMGLEEGFSLRIRERPQNREMIP
ncbi:MAG: hypothetical protein ACE5HE_01450 [Phycisphaerae bacterium]